MRIIFFGTPPIAAEVLEDLFNKGAQIVAVISKPDRPKGRSGDPVPTSVKLTALKHDPTLPVFQPEIVSAPDFAETLKQFDADLFVVVAYGEIIKQHLLDMPRKACINLHASLLPKYRGAAPIQRCIMAGESETGVTIMHMVKKMDAGDMIKKIVIPIGEETTFGELEHQICEAGKKALWEVLLDFEKGIPESIPQDHTQATLAPKIELEDCEIDWNRSAKELHNLIRGVNPYPGAWCSVLIKGEKKRMKIFQSKIIPCDQAIPKSMIPQSTNKNLLIGTGDGALELLEIQLEGKKKMSSEELMRGLSQHFQIL